MFEYCIFELTLASVRLQLVRFYANFPHHAPLFYSVGRQLIVHFPMTYHIHYSGLSQQHPIWTGVPSGSLRCISLSYHMWYRKVNEMCSGFVALSFVAVMNFLVRLIFTSQMLFYFNHLWSLKYLWLFVMSAIILLQTIQILFRCMCKFQSRTSYEDFFTFLCESLVVSADAIGDALS